MEFMSDMAQQLQPPPTHTHTLQSTAFQGSRWERMGEGKQDGST